VTPHNGSIVVGYVVRKFPVLSETFVLNELLGLEAQGVKLHIFSLQKPNDPRFHEDLPKLKARVSYVPDLFALGKLFRHGRRVARSTGKSYRDALLYTAIHGDRHLWWRFLQAGYIANEARRLKVTHLHAQFANRPTSVAYLASKITGIPYSFTAHATDIFKHQVDRSVLARKMEAARFVVTVSDYNQKYLEDIAPETGEEIARIYNGIDLQRFKPNGVPEADRFRFVAVARLVEKKGLMDLIEACRILSGEGLSFQCDIVGKGRLRSRLRDRIKELGLQKVVRLVGPKSQREVLREYHHCHAYVLPAVVGEDGNREGLPVSIVEALACGLPVITTPITGIPEAVRHGENGLLVPERDPAALARAMASVIRNPVLYKALANNARESVQEKFDRTETAKTLLQLMEGETS
jgi:glycosyltransferase involved in cell wall biosynthesis